MTGGAGLLTACRSATVACRAPALAQRSSCLLKRKTRPAAVTYWKFQAGEVHCCQLIKGEPLRRQQVRSRGNGPAHFYCAFSRSGEPIRVFGQLSALSSECTARDACNLKGSGGKVDVQRRHPEVWIVPHSRPECCTFSIPYRRASARRKPPENSVSRVRSDSLQYGSEQKSRRTAPLSRTKSNSVSILRLGGGAGGIRTLDTVLPYTHFPGERLRPLGHRSACPGRSAP